MDSDRHCMSVIVSAIAWLPFIEIIADSTRVSQSSEQAAAGSLQPLMMVKMFLPYFFDNPAGGFKWGPAWSGYPNVLFYLTWPGLLLLINAGRRKQNRALLFVCVLTIGLALGNNLPFFELIQKTVPFFKVSRGPSMILV
jgi:peptidoglycan/LPS O-acetylase OafA/YrhL